MLFTTATVGFFVGALAITGLVSRLVLWMLRGWPGGYGRVVFVHVASLAFAIVCAGFAFALNSTGSGFAPTAAMEAYLLPQCVWLVADLIRLSFKRKASPALSPVRVRVEPR
jgi:hypothetical protein